MTLTFHRYGSKATTDTLELDETKSSIIDKLSEPTRLSAILTTTTAPQIALGNYTTYEGTRYYVTKEPTVRKEHSQLYTVEVDLERSLGLARITILANPIDHRTTFDYTGTATEHLQLIVDCLNAKFGEVGLKWTRGAVHCKDTIKHIKYDGTTVLGALQQIRETYETDIFADGETLSLGQTDDKTTALPLAYGKGKGLLSGLERHKHTDDTIPTRLYVTGTKRNMTTGRLTLQRGVVLAVDRKSGAIERHSGDISAVADERTFYRTDKEGQYIAEWSPMDKFKMWETRFPTEATYTNEEIYPSHVSTIKTVTKVKDHYEVNSDFNYTPLRIEGEQMQVVFQTGNLAGRDFDAKYFASSGRLAIVPKEEDDTTLPNDTLCPKVGDQYIVTGIKLPDQYIREAERNLTDEALRHLIKLQETRYSYKADIDPVYLHNTKTTIGNKLDVGQYVHLTDQQIAVGDPYIRIVGKRTYLDRPYTPEIELSNEIEPRSELTRVLNELDRQDNGLTSILDRLRQSGLTLGELTVGVGELTVSAEEMRKRLETAEQELTDKLDSEVFTQWRTGDFKQALTSELATSAQQTLAEALKRAGEMDKQIKVGGRNLIRNSGRRISNTSYLPAIYDITTPREMKCGDVYSIRIWGTMDREITPLRINNSDGWVFLIYTTYNAEEGAWEATFKWDDRHPTNPADNTSIRIYADAQNQAGVAPFTTTIERIMLVKGNVLPQSWTPAPEDVAESVSKVNTSVTSLASTLLDPEQGEIHKLTSLLESHKTATDKSFAELSNHPLTIDKDGFWQVWSLKDKQYVATQYQSRGQQGEPGHSPSAEEVVKTESFQKRLSGEVMQQVKPVRDDLDNAKIDFVQGLQQTSLALNDLSQHLGEELSTATTNITNLQNVALTLQQKQDLGLLTSALRLKMAGGEGDKKTLEGLALQKYIALSGDNKTVTAYLASDTLDAVLKAGITGFGTEGEREQVAINHNGTGHLGNLYFTGSQIDFRTSRDADPYLSMGAEENQFISEFLATARLDDTPVSVGTVTLSEQSKVYEQTVSADHDGTRLTVTIDELEVAVYETAKVRLLLDNDVLDTWMGITSFREGGGGAFNGVPDFRAEYVPYKGSNLSYERVVKAGSHTLRLEIAGKMGSGDSGATIKGLRIKRRYDTGRQQSAFAKNGLRLFGSPDRYFDVDYREKYSKVVRYYYGLPITEFVPNPYLVRIKGGAKVDRLTVDELDMPGVPLCGASFNEKGGQIKAFGKYANQRGTNRAQAVYDYSMGAFKVYHSIGNTRYIPIVQVSGWESGDVNWSLTPRVYEVKSDYFVVRVLSNNDNPHNTPISYAAFKTM